MNMGLCHDSLHGVLKAAPLGYQQTQFFTEAITLNLPTIKDILEGAGINNSNVSKLI